MQGNNKNKLNLNPFPGLRPFTHTENHLFFGREGQSEKIIECLSQNRFVAITGASGSGKSSLLYCGVLSLIYGGFVGNTGSNWRVFNFRPGSSPYKNLAKEITQKTPAIPAEEKKYFQSITQSVIRTSSLGLVEMFKKIELEPNENILLIVDQFEELFRFREQKLNAEARNETEAFINLLVESIKQTELPVHVIITMRSDFMGECSNFQEFTDLINASNFLIPQMSREDYRRAITGPVLVAKAQIEERLVQELLNNVGDEKDQLSVIQHALMRTWEFWKKYKDPSTPISFVDYEAAGKMEKALSLHANEAYDELSTDGRRICRSMFTTLTERSEDNRGIRHPEKISEIASIAKAPTQEVIDVIDAFRTKGRAFLTPGPEVELTENTVIDISHESIMRIWDRLKQWSQEEIESVQMYLRLCEAAALYQSGKSGLWRPPDLLMALSWRKKFQPNLGWAKRYDPAFERAMMFLETSEKKYRAEERHKIKLQKRTLKRTRAFAGLLGVIAVVFLGLMFYAYLQKSEVEIQKQRAEELRQEAETQSQIAIQQKQIADSLRLMWQDAATLEQQRRVLAEEESRLSEEKKEEALLTVSEIEEKSQQLYQNTIEERQQREEVEKALEEVVKEKSEVEKEKQLAYQKRVLSIARSMSVRSLQINDKTLKGLLATQAYNFNATYSVIQHNPDIYSGLYKALEQLNPSKYWGFKGHNGAVRDVTFKPGTNTFFTAGGDGKILVWNAEIPNTKPGVLANNDFINRCLVISSDGKWLGSGGESDIEVFNLDNPDEDPIILTGHNGWVWSLDFVPGTNTLISTSADNTVRKWSLESKEFEVIASSSKKIRMVKVSPDKQFVALALDDGKIEQWNIATKENKILYEIANNSFYALDYDPTGKYLAFGDKYGAVRIVNISTAQLVNTFSEHKARILDIDFSPNAKYLASSSLDGTINLWALENMQLPPIVLTGHNAWVLSVSFSSDSRYLVSSSDKGNLVMLWPINMNEMANEICKNVGRNLSKEEWLTYVASDVPYEQTCDK